MSKNKRAGFHSQTIQLTNGVKGYMSFEKSEESKKIEDSVQEFLIYGGTIQKIDDGETAFKPISRKKLYIRGG